MFAIKILDTYIFYKYVNGWIYTLNEVLLNIVINSRDSSQLDAFHFITRYAKNVTNNVPAN